MNIRGNTIDKISGKRLLVVNFTGSTPHIETSLEILRRLNSQNYVNYIQLAQHVTRPTLFPSNIIKRKFQLSVRLRRCKLYIRKYCSKGNKTRIIDSNKFLINVEKELNKSTSQCPQLNIPNAEELKILKFKDYNIGLGILSSLISTSKDPSPFPLDNKSRKELHQLYLTSIKSILFAENILRENENEFKGNLPM